MCFASSRWYVTDTGLIPFKVFVFWLSSPTASQTNHVIQEYRVVPPLCFKIGLKIVHFDQMSS